MTKISQYSTDVNITGNDKWIGSDAQNYLITKNFTPNNLANYFNGNNVIDIGTSIRYTYQTLDPGEAREQGTISFETEIGPQVNFSDISTFLIAKNTLKGNTVTQYLDFLVGGKVLLSKSSNINVFGYYSITNIEPWIPNTNFFVVTVDFLSGNGFIYEDLDYLVSLVDKSQGSGTTSWGSITGDIEDQTDLISYIASQVTALDWSQTLDNGRNTGGFNPLINNDDAIELENSSTLKKGTYDFGANGGISRICGVGFEDMWQSGIRHVFDSNGFIRNSTNCFDIIPDASFDNTLRFKVDSLWTLDNGDTYKCTDASTGAAVWELVNTGSIPNLQQVTDALLNDGIAETTNGIKAGTCYMTVDGFFEGNEEGGIYFQIQNSEPSFVQIDEFGSYHYLTLRAPFPLTSSHLVTFQGTSGTVALLSDIPTIQAGTNITIDDTDPLNPIINASISGGGGIPHATAAGTDTYTATITGVASYADGDAYLIRFTNGNTTGATLNINSLGAVTLYRNNDGPLIGGDVQSGGEMLCVYNSTLSIFQCIGTSPNSIISYVTNADSVTITKGMPVYAFGGTGDRMTVKRANNTSDATSAQTVGLVMSTSIAANQKGFIIMQGLLDGLSILPTATFADGDPVYLGTTAGSITNTKQYAPNHLVYLGVVTTASNGSAGRMYVRVQNGYELDELHNVQARTPSLNDTLWYDNTVSPAQWKTASIPTILGYTPQQQLSGTGFVKISGTTISYDNSTYYLASNPSGFTSNLGTVTSVAALTLGTSGTDLSSSVATGTTTPVITLNVPTANASNRGVLSPTDWSTFNNKQFPLIKQGYTTLTGVTGTQVLSSLLIPANWLASGDGFEIIIVPAKTTTAANIGFFLYHDTTLNGVTNAIATGTSISVNQRIGFIQRIMSLNSTTLYNCLPVNATSLFPTTSTGTAPTTTFNPAVNNWITLTVNPTVGSEVTGFHQFFIRKL